MEKRVKFTLESRDHQARTGSLRVGDRQFTTPMLVQNGSTIARLTSRELRQLGTTAIKQSALPYWLTAANINRVKFGNLHDRLHWSGLVVGVSGASRAYQLAKPRGRKKTGVSFREPATGHQRLYTPTEALEWQEKLGCDLESAFARWESYYSPVDDLQAAAQQTAGWLPDRPSANLLAPVVGGGLKRVRQFSATSAAAIDPLGYCIAGIDPPVSLAEQKRLLHETVAMLPQDGLRYLPTNGALEQALWAVMSGIDLVDTDCAGQAAQRGVAFIRARRLHLAKEHMMTDQRVLVAGCQCPTCQAGYTRSFLHQLVIGSRPLGIRLLLVHNLYTLNQLMADLRQAIRAGQFEDFIHRLSIGD